MPKEVAATEREKKLKSLETNDDEEVSALSCYSCDHLESESICEDNLIECDTSSASLGMMRVAAFKPTLQIIQSTSFRCFELLIENTPGQILRTRGCSFDTVDVCQGEPRIGVQTGCRWCNDHDGCNSAGSFKGSMHLLAGLLVIAMLQKIF
uniref:Protein sleepless n=1 Tax=Anopheles farauti TaxID=69004 RepID=A0A182Q1M0_9DIPT